MSGINSVRKLQILYFSKKIRGIKKSKKRRKIFGPKFSFKHTTDSWLITSDRLSKSTQG